MQTTRTQVKYVKRIVKRCVVVVSLSHLHAKNMHVYCTYIESIAKKIDASINQRLTICAIITVSICISILLHMKCDDNQPKKKKRYTL